MTLIKNTFGTVKKAASLALVGLGLTLGISTQAQTPAYVSFLQNGGNVLLPFSAAATSTNYNDVYAATLGTNGLYWIKNYVQTNSTTVPPTSGYSPVWAQGIPFCDAGLWANRDGTTPLAAFNLSAYTVNQASGAGTNIIKVTLTTINRTSDSLSGGAGPIYNNQSQNTFTFTATNATASTNALGYDTISVSTNLPTSFLQGALALQMQLNIGPAGTNAGTSYFTNVTGPYSALVTNTVNGWNITSAGISGFKPSAAQ